MAGQVLLMTFCKLHLHIYLFSRGVTQVLEIVLC